ncbi:Uncharacterised protein [Grimontia hollisae]|uniref:Uncharacterized protein n=1 Tax=Grimontia hollisae TaxID=673 RepID=A0A377J8Q0_GRIHO|nr:Uncharacterised protein [Grimontia hollisae]
MRSVILIEVFKPCIFKFNGHKIIFVWRQYTLHNLIVQYYFAPMRTFRLRLTPKVNVFIRKYF